jgi:hypothetical protein
MREARVMIDVKMGQNELAHIPRAYAKRPQLRACLLLGFDLELNSELKIGMPGG